MTHAVCNSARLQQLLDNHLPIAEATAVEQHLANCVICQRELHSYAADETWWARLGDLHPQSDMNVAITRTTAASCLDPSDNPAMLGRLGEFEVLEIIGRGGMGVVFKGYDDQLNRWVAIKVLGPHLAESTAARRRFVREAQAAAAVVHPHVIGIHAVDSLHQPPYFVMNFIPGETLQERIERVGPLSIEDVLSIGQQVADGLSAAHAQGLVHRDVKPANILLERNVDRVVLTDFGLARAADEASLTQSGLLAGTPPYMSPEQARGDAVDPRSDLFSLGSVLYTLLAGHPPFRAESSLAILRRVTDDTPRQLREVNANVPLWLEQLVATLMAKSPQARFGSAAHVAQLLEQALAHVRQPLVSPLPAELRNSRHRPHARQRWIRNGVGAVAATVAILGASQLWPTTAPLPIERPPSIPQAVAQNAAVPSSESAFATTISEDPLPPWDDQSAVDDLAADVLQREADIDWPYGP